MYCYPHFPEEEKEAHIISDVAWVTQLAGIVSLSHHAASQGWGWGWAGTEPGQLDTNDATLLVSSWSHRRSSPHVKQ